MAPDVMLRKLLYLQQLLADLDDFGQLVALFAADLNDESQSEDSSR